MVDFAECNWNDVPDVWNTTDRLWNSVCPFITEVVGEGGKGSPEDGLKAYEKLDKRIPRIVYEEFGPVTEATKQRKVMR